MRCENRYCYFEKDGSCRFPSIVVDSDGKCALCVRILPTEETISKAKQEALPPPKE